MSQPIQENKVTTSIPKLLNSKEFKKELIKLLPPYMNPERMIRIALTELRLKPALTRCNPLSFAQALLQCADLKLEPSSQLDHGYFVPYKDECKWITGYKGMITLARRSGEIKSIYASTVYEGDKIEVIKGTNEQLNHVLSLHNRGGAIAYYSYVKLLNGGQNFELMLPEDIEEARKRSKTANNGPWQTDYNAMANKTTIRRVFKYLPLESNSDLNKALEYEEALDLGNEGMLIDAPSFDVSSNETIIDSKDDEMAERLGA